VLEGCSQNKEIELATCFYRSQDFISIQLGLLRFGSGNMSFVIDFNFKHNFFLIKLLRFFMFEFKIYDERHASTGTLEFGLWLIFIKEPISSLDSYPKFVLNTYEVVSPRHSNLQLI
jgi:hypothetical protein